jgi:hypothetical protein
MAIEGSLDLVTEHFVTGWAFDSGAPEMHLTAVVMLGNRPIGEARCNLYRPDLHEAQVGEGDHAFTFNFPDALGPQDISRISASVAGMALPIGGDADNGNSLPQITRALAADFRKQEATASSASAQPVFILGSVRSGTSAITTALACGTRYVGFREGQVFDLLHQIQECARGFYMDKHSSLQNDTVMLRYVPLEYITDLLGSAFRDLADRLFSSRYWVDKTPNVDMIRLAPTLLRVWPKARFIYMKRRGIDNLMSRLRKFPDTVTFRTHCADWAQSMRAWEEVRPKLGDQGIEIDQHDMLSEPQIVAQRVGNFLELNHAEILSLGVQLQDRTLERTAASVHDTPALCDTGWTCEQITIFLNLCGPTMRMFGYGVEKSYFDRGADMLQPAAATSRSSQ